MTKSDRANFGSKLGVILASAGSAVGLGNIWRFPFETGNHGGAAFILVYLVCVLILGIPIMIAEFLIGRRSRANTARAYQKLAPGTHWRWVGRMGVLAGFLILGYYSVVAGWTLEFIGEAATNSFAGKSAADFIASFNSFVSNPWRPVIWLVLFLLATHLIIVKGVEKGIEKSAKIMMPMLFVLLIILAICSISLPGAGAGIEFLLKPDFSKVDGNVFLGAMGQAFFSLSIAGSGTVVYGSYLKSDVDIVSSAKYVAFFDTLAALLAGLVIIPAVFAYGMEPNSGPGLLFITIPAVIRSIPFGQIFATLFFLAVLFAGATSLVNLLESPVEALQSRFGWSRRSSLILVGAITAAAGLFVEGDLLSPWMDTISIYVIPLGALLAGITMFWVCGKTFARNAVQLGRKRTLGQWFEPMTRYVFCGVALVVYILGIFFGGIG